MTIGVVVYVLAGCLLSYKMLPQVFEFILAVVLWPLLVVAAAIVAMVKE